MPFFICYHRMPVENGRKLNPPQPAASEKLYFYSSCQEAPETFLFSQEEMYLQMSNSSNCCCGSWLTEVLWTISHPWSVLKWLKIFKLKPRLPHLNHTNLLLARVLFGRKQSNWHLLNTFCNLPPTPKKLTGSPAEKQLVGTDLPNPATQCTATQLPGSSRNLVFSRFSQSSTIWLGGGAPSSKGQSLEGRKTEGY